MTGVDRLRAKLLAVAPACESAGEEAARQAAEGARDLAAGLAPVETGRLRGSLTVTSAGTSAEVCADCEYAAAVELGGRGRPARPFMLPAAQASAAGFFDLARRLAARAVGGLRG